MNHGITTRIDKRNCKRYLEETPYPRQLNISQPICYIQIKQQTHLMGLLARGLRIGLTIPRDLSTSVVEGPGAVLKRRR
jgi:hypothetical protein